MAACLIIVSSYVKHDVFHSPRGQSIYSPQAQGRTKKEGNSRRRPFESDSHCVSKNDLPREFPLARSSGSSAKHLRLTPRTRPGFLVLLISSCSSSSIACRSPAVICCSAFMLLNEERKRFQTLRDRPRARNDVDGLRSQTCGADRVRVFVGVNPNLVF